MDDAIALRTIDRFIAQQDEEDERQISAMLENAALVLCIIEAGEEPSEPVS